jgi:hypothetical protein
MDVTEDQEFLWIAVEAMFAPLPRNWQEFENESGQIYYYNHRLVHKCPSIHLGHITFSSTKISQWEHPLDEYHKSLYRKQKDEKLKSSAPSRSVHAGKADKKWQEQDGKAAVMKSKHHQEVASEATSSAVVLQRPKSAARAGIRPSTRFVVFVDTSYILLSCLQGWACRACCRRGERTTASAGRTRS